MPIQDNPGRKLQIRREVRPLFLNGRSLNTHKERVDKSRAQLPTEEARVNADILHEQKSRYSPRRVMKTSVRTSDRRMSLSPGFISGVIRSLSDYHIPEGGPSTIVQPTLSLDATSSTTNPKSPLRRPIEHYASMTLDSVKVAHVPGGNDFMSGALGPRDEASRLEQNDKLVSDKDLPSQFKYMPWRMLTAKDLAEIPGLFMNPRQCELQLGVDFLTTNEGLRRTIEECRAIGFQGAQQDALVLGELVRRGGQCVWKPHHGGGGVLYPEEMQFMISEYDLCDWSYWDELIAQGEIWNEMPPI